MMKYCEEKSVEFFLFCCEYCKDQLWHDEGAVMVTFECEIGREYFPGKDSSSIWLAEDRRMQLDTREILVTLPQ